MLNYVKAFVIMLIAHRGQKDKANKPYFLHPFRVSRNMTDTKAKVVALLHDVLEDSDKYTINDFTFLDDEQKTALLLLTHDKNQDYFEYINAVKENRLAKCVKLMDLRDNLNIKRIKNPGEKDLQRLDKYKLALDILLSH